MKLFVLILLITFLSVQLMQNIRKVPKFYNEEAIDENELGDFQKLLNRFNLLSSSTSGNILNKGQII